MLFIYWMWSCSCCLFVHLYLACSVLHVYLHASVNITLFSKEIVCVCVRGGSVCVCWGGSCSLLCDNFSYICTQSRRWRVKETLSKREREEEERGECKERHTISSLKFVNLHFHNVGSCFWVCLLMLIFM